MKSNWVLLIGLFCLTATLSCNKEGCTDSSATNYDEKAKKDDGSCILPDPDPRDAYVGNYLVTDSLYIFESFSEANTYTLQVTLDGTVSDTIYLNNLWNGGDKFIALMAGSNFSIPSQHVSGPYYASGSGNFADDIITYETSGDAYINEGVGPKQ